MTTSPSHAKATYSATYPAIEPTQPALSTASKVVLVTGASAIILLGRRAGALAETASVVRSSHAQVAIRTYEAELYDSSSVRDAMKQAGAEFGGIDILVRCAGSLTPAVPLLEADPATFIDGYKTTVVGMLATAQAVVLANKAVSGEERPVTFINLTTAGILFPPFPGMGSYVSSKMAAVKLLQSFVAENPYVLLHNVHPFQAQDFFPAVSLPADFLVWIASPEAEFLREKIVFAAWDVDELKARAKEIIGRPPRTGELWLGFQGFHRYMAGQPLPGTN
ncbi:hypothetical protein BDW60DRAFT_219672 [Aspergillus nidulans var. acristatus]